MKNQYTPSEQKLFNMLQYAPMGVAGINSNGIMTLLNKAGDAMLQPFIKAHQLDPENGIEVFRHFAPAIAAKITAFKEKSGVIVMNEMYPCEIHSANGIITRIINFIVNKADEESIGITFDDITDNYEKEKKMQQLEIASGVLHDIGNAVVSFGSYLTRVKRMMELTNLDNLEKLAALLGGMEANLVPCLGDKKAHAVVEMLNGIASSQKEQQQDLKKAISEQMQIIIHIQEILQIQRQYVAGNDSSERKPVRMRAIINDCMAMLFASFDKRGIEVALNIPADLPLVEGDKTQLMQVTLNILKNSMEAIDSHTGEKKITVQAYSDPHWLVLLVQDTGTGFDTITASHLFQRGFTTKHNGTGLGLYNCRAIIESHGGTIQITSDGPGKGSFTELKLPLTIDINK